MKTSIMKRSLSILLSVMMIVGVFVSTAAISADAALSGEQMSSEYQITINDVTRKYPLAKQLLDGINAERTTRGLVTLRMDSALMEQTMVRAAELPLYFSKYSLMEDDYSLKAIMYEDYSSQHYFEGVFVMRGSVSEAVSAFFSDSNYSAVVTNSYAKEIGIGAVEVGSNNVTFICLRTTDEMTDKGTYRAVDSSVYSSETTIDQTTNTLGKNMDLQDPPATMTTKVGKRTVVNFDVNEVQGLGYKATVKPGMLSALPLYTQKLGIDEVEPNVFTPTQTVSNVTLRIVIDAQNDGTQISKTTKVTVKEASDELEVSLSSSADTIAYGGSAVLTATVENGTGPYTYTFFDENENELYCGSENTCTFTGTEVGEHEITVLVEDAEEAQAVANKTITVAAALNVEISNEPAAITAGDEITIHPSVRSMRKSTLLSPLQRTREIRQPKRYLKSQ